MGRHVFVDESKRRDVVLVAVSIDRQLVDQTSKAVRSLLLPGQRQIHMVKESAGRQRTILELLGTLRLDVQIYIAPKGSRATERLARQACLRAMVDDLGRLEANSICLDRDDSLVSDDRRVIRGALLGGASEIRYHHDKASNEPLLSLPDAVAWAWPQRRWRALCSTLVDGVTTV